MILITGRGFLPQQSRVSWSQYALQVPPSHRNAVGYNPLAVLVIMYQKEGGYTAQLGCGHPSETWCWCPRRAQQPLPSRAPITLTRSALLTSFPHLLVFPSVRVSVSFTRSRVQILVDVFHPYTGFFQHRRCSSSHNGLRGITHPVQHFAQKPISPFQQGSNLP